MAGRRADSQFNQHDAVLHARLPRRLSDPGTPSPCLVPVPAAHHTATRTSAAHEHG